MVASIDEQNQSVHGEFLRQAFHGNWKDEKHYWISDPLHGFIPVSLADKETETEISIKLPDDSIKQVLKSRVLPANSARYDKHEDMAELGELNEATILHTLKSRYLSNLCYTYSGLFLIAINPYKELPIYNVRTMEWFKGQPKNDRPPHIYAVADVAYRDLLRSGLNQSILITGESGAGKTENTKKVIQYLASITGGQFGDLEQKILSTNPILESFGNAQTVRNNNSSRFGKFVRIEFSEQGRITGANIERFLLEKSRVTHRSKEERSFHIFYQLLSAKSDLSEKLFLSSGISHYKLLNCSNCSIDGVDDRQEFDNLIEAMKKIGISEEEQFSLFMIISVILHLGNIELKSDEFDQAFIKDEQPIHIICKLLKVDFDSFKSALLNPVIKAGKETVIQGRDIVQVGHSLEFLSRTLYERLFSWLVDRLNRAIKPLSSANSSRFIGVLDIAGFEIFEKNSFEQLCVNYTNEKLQQFYNHHMFVREKEEYNKEHVQWNFTDFGLDLQPTIDLLEKSNPVGVFACLDEDCIVPKATDRSFTEKLLSLWKGKSGKLEGLRFGNGFSLEHYAGKIEYQTDGWLDKNKDSVNYSILQVLCDSENPFVQNLAADDVKLSAIVKKGLFRTVAQKHRESLLLLMQQLSITRPHFVRCIVPNQEKKAGYLDAHVVLDQLKCNGVFEGIRICRNGYPARVSIDEFIQTFWPVLSNAPESNDPKFICKAILEQVTQLDDCRDVVLTKHAIVIQRFSKMKFSKNILLKRSGQHEALQVVADCLPKFLELRKSSLWKLFCHVRPLLNVARAENKISDLQVELERVISERDSQTLHLRNELEAERIKLFEAETAKHKMEKVLRQTEMYLSESNETKQSLSERRIDLEMEILRLQDKICKELEPNLDAHKVLSEKYLFEKNMIEQELLDVKNELAVAKEQSNCLEFEKIKYEKQESFLKSRIVEYEQTCEQNWSLLSSSNMKRKEIEECLSIQTEKYNQLSNDQKMLKDQLIERDVSIKSMKSKYEEEMKIQTEIFEQAKYKSAREIQHLKSELEAERKLNEQLREDVKRYEMGADNLANQLENEQRTLSQWKRDKERLELRIAEMMDNFEKQKEIEEYLRQDLLNEQQKLREANRKIVSIEDDLFDKEKKIKSLESKNSDLAEAIKNIHSVNQDNEQQLKTAKEQSGVIYNQYYAALDEAALLSERLRLAMNSKLLIDAQWKDDQSRLAELVEEKRLLEKSLRDARSLIQELESRIPEQAGLNLKTALERVTRESEVRESSIKELHRIERLLKEMQSVQSVLEREKIDAEQAKSRHELTIRRQQTRMDELVFLKEAERNELEMEKRKLERLV